MNDTKPSRSPLFFYMCSVVAATVTTLSLTGCTGGATPGTVSDTVLPSPSYVVPSPVASLPLVSTSPSGGAAVTYAQFSQALFANTTSADVSTQVKNTLASLGDTGATQVTNVALPASAQTLPVALVQFQSPGDVGCVFILSGSETSSGKVETTWYAHPCADVASVMFSATTPG